MLMARVPSLADFFQNLGHEQQKSCSRLLGTGRHQIIRAVPRLLAKPSSCVVRRSSMVRSICSHSAPGETSLGFLELKTAAHL